MADFFFSYVLTVLKILSPILAAILGAYALRGNFIDHSGRLNKWGKGGVLGFILFATISAGSELIGVVKGHTEAQQKAAETLELVTSTNRVLHDINRSMYPFEDLVVSFAAYPFLEGDLLQRYISRLPKNVNDSSSGDKLATGQSMSSDGKRWFMSYSPESSLYPSSRKESEVYHLFRRPYLTLSFYRNAMDMNPSPGRTFPAGDIEATLYMSSLSQSDDALLYNGGEQSVEITAQSIHLNPVYWRNNGEILSMYDLAGGMMVIHFGNDSMETLKFGYELKYLNFRVNKSRRFYFRKSNFQRYNYRDNPPFFVVNFPKEFDGFREYELR